jgi:hypothetical protein
VSATVSSLTYAQAARIVREATKDKSYQLFPLGMEAAAYLRTSASGSRRAPSASTSRRWTSSPATSSTSSSATSSRRSGPSGSRSSWTPILGPDKAEPRTYNSNLSVIKDFFKYLVARGELHGDPTLTIERAKARDPHRETFSVDQFRAIIASQDELRDRSCCG